MESRLSLAWTLTTAGSKLKVMSKPPAPDDGTASTTTSTSTASPMLVRATHVSVGPSVPGSQGLPAQAAERLAVVPVSIASLSMSAAARAPNGSPTFVSMTTTMASDAARNSAGTINQRFIYQALTGISFLHYMHAGEAENRRSR
jgi:hypothetical protein